MLLSCSDAGDGKTAQRRDRGIEAQDTVPQTTAPPRASTGVTILPPHSRYDLPGCAAFEKSSSDDGADLFEQHYPPELIDPGTVEDTTLYAADLDTVTGFAACAAAITDYEPFVADNALALFASKKHGAAAFAALQRAAVGSTFAAKAAREFSSQMREYVKAR